MDLHRLSGAEEVALIPVQTLLKMGLLQQLFLKELYCPHLTTSLRRICLARLRGRGGLTSLAFHRGAGAGSQQGAHSHPDFSQRCVRLLLRPSTPAFRCVHMVVFYAFRDTTQPLWGYFPVTPLSVDESPCLQMVYLLETSQYPPAFNDVVLWDPPEFNCGETAKRAITKDIHKYLQRIISSCKCI